MRETLNGVSRRVETDLRDRLFAHLQRMSAEFYDRYPTGDLMARTTNDLLAVRMVAGPGLMYLSDTVVRAAMVLPYMLHISPRLTGLALLPLARPSGRHGVLRPGHPPPDATRSRPPSPTSPARSTRTSPAPGSCAPIDRSRGDRALPDDKRRVRQPQSVTRAGLGRLPPAAGAARRARRRGGDLGRGSPGDRGHDDGRRVRRLRRRTWSRWCGR